MTSSADPPSITPSTRLATWRRTAVQAGSALRRGFLGYARWLEGISWKRFALLALLAVVCGKILEDLPPFNIPWGRDRSEARVDSVALSDKNRNAPIQIDGIRGLDGRRYEVRVDASGVQVRPVPGTARPPDVPVPPASSTLKGLPPVPPQPPAADPSTSEIAEALAEAREALAEAGIVKLDAPQVINIRAFRLGDVLEQTLALAIVLSFGIKIMASGRFRAEAKAEQATEKAESEQIKRHVVEARMATMQAQIEPHFLFNTLASIDHLIETDPPRASLMQKNLIALLRASMPGLREAQSAGSGGVRDLGREVEVIRPYIEILQVRMDERLQAAIDIPEGLLSAEFPPMMIQGLVENAIKHGLEPKPEGGRLDVSAKVEHGQLVVRVADTGVGFGKAATSGTGVGLANLRERLDLLYGRAGALVITDNRPTGTVVTMTIPYRSAGPRTNA